MGCYWTLEPNTIVKLHSSPFKRKKGASIKFIGLYKLFIYIYYSKIRKQSYLKLEVKYSYINTTLNSNKRLKKYFM